MKKTDSHNRRKLHSDTIILTSGYYQMLKTDTLWRQTIWWRKWVLHH